MEIFYGIGNANDPIAGTERFDDIFTFKLNSSGELIWLQIYPGNSTDFGRDLVLVNNFLYILSSTKSTNFGTVTGSDHDLLIARILSGNGKMVFLYSCRRLL